MNRSPKDMVRQTDMAGEENPPGACAQLPACRVNATIARMLSGVKQASALWQEDPCRERLRRSDLGSGMYRSGYNRGGPRESLLRRYADRSRESVHQPRRVASMRQKSDHMTRKLQDYLVEEFTESLREDLGLLNLGRAAGQNVPRSLASFNKRIDQQDEERENTSGSLIISNHSDPIKASNVLFHIQNSGNTPQNGFSPPSGSSPPRKLTVLRKGGCEDRRQRPQSVSEPRQLAPGGNSAGESERLAPRVPVSSEAPVSLTKATLEETSTTPWPHFSQGPSRTAVLLREKKIPPMPTSQPPSLPPHLQGDFGMSSSPPPERNDVIIAGDPNPVEVAAGAPPNEDSDLDIVPDGIDIKHLPLLRSKKMVEKDLKDRLEKKMESEDRLLGDLRLSMERPTTWEKVITATRVVQEVIQTAIVRDANGNRIYRIAVDLGKFHRHMKHVVKEDVVEIEGSTFGPTETMLTKEVNIRLPETVVMEQLVVRQIGPTVELEVPFKRSEAMLNLVELIKKLDEEKEERLRRERDRWDRHLDLARDDPGEVVSDHGSVTSEPVSTGSDPVDHEQALPETTVIVTHRKMAVRPTRRRRKTTNCDQGQNSSK